MATITHITDSERDGFTLTPTGTREHTTVRCLRERMGVGGECGAEWTEFSEEDAITTWRRHDYIMHPQPLPASWYAAQR